MEDKLGNSRSTACGECSESNQTLKQCRLYNTATVLFCFRPKIIRMRVKTFWNLSLMWPSLFLGLRLGLRCECLHPACRTRSTLLSFSLGTKKTHGYILKKLSNLVKFKHKNIVWFVFFFFLDENSVLVCF